MARIAIGGFQHETNSFAPTPARLADFVAPDAWPGLVRGPELLPAIAGINLPAAGFAEAAAAAGHELVPLLWCSASPLGLVEADAYETIAGWLLEAIRAAGRLDAIYLDLHGAMVAAHLEDGEGELLRRIRALVGPDLPLVASLDLHANVTAAMVEHATLLVAYRTYPHVDMAETGARAARALPPLLAGARPAKAFRKLDFLVPLPWQCTMIAPGAGLYGGLAARETAGGELLGLSLAMGFPQADIAECGPSVLAYGSTKAAADAAAAALAAELAAAEPAFAGRIWSPDEAVAEAMRQAAAGGRPVVLADTQDNPGAGCDSDTMAVTEALVRHGARGALSGLICDPAAAAAAHEAGEGTELALALGGRSPVPDSRPLQARFRVVRLGDGAFTGEGPFYKGARMQLGPMALLETGGVRIAVSSRKQQAADQAMFRHLGADPARHPILALKSSVHFRADFEPIAGAILIVAAPGASPVDHRRLAYRRLRPGVRLMPAAAG
ncbi:MAG: M81 family metallopeptidase [Dongiaceae bacterium]